jgi:hypothetical protein
MPIRSTTTHPSSNVAALRQNGFKHTVKGDLALQVTFKKVVYSSPDLKEGECETYLGLGVGLR